MEQKHRNLVCQSPHKCKFGVSQESAWRVIDCDLAIHAGVYVLRYYILVIVSGELNWKWFYSALSSN